MSTPPQVAVIGGGISGLSCAYRLQKLGASVLLLETHDRAGGLIGTVEKNGFRFESGPQSFLGAPQVLELVRDLGLEGKLLKADPRAPRYVLVRGRLRAVPMSPPAILTSSLLSISSRYRILTEALHRSQPPNLEESVADFVRRKFGHEILEYLVAPFVSGVYAGDPEMLSLKSAFPYLDQWERQYGSVIRGAMGARKGQADPRPGLCSFSGGFRSLLDGFTSALGASLVPNTRVETIERNDGDATSGFTLQLLHGSQRETVSVTAIVVAAPAYAAGHFLDGISPHLARTLSGVPYAPVAVVGMGFNRLQVGNSLAGFGVLIPRKEGIRTLGTVWNSSLFPCCAPNGSVLVTSFVGGATDPEIVEKNADFIGEIVEEEIGKVLQISGAPVERHIWRYGKALPQYNLGHGKIVEGVRAEAAKLPGLFLVGNYLDGPSIGDCIDLSNRTAGAVRSFLAGDRGEAGLNAGTRATS
ncbi:MAG: protoporphyrinogen oxidase [Candidatus Acidiferrales bacterium]